MVEDHARCTPAQRGVPGSVREWIAAYSYIRGWHSGVGKVNMLRGEDPHRPCPRSGRDTSPHGGRQEGVAFVRADAVRAATIGRGVQGRVVTPFPSFPLKGEGECDVLIHIVISLQVNALRVNLTLGLAVTIIDLDVWG